MILRCVLGFVIAVLGAGEARGADVAPQEGVDAWGVYGERFDLVVGRNVEQFTSFATYESLGSEMPVVMYDPEPWDATPATEQERPKFYMRAFVALAHSRGQEVILAPARSLAQDCARENEDLAHAFARCRYGAIRTDYFQLQAQKLQCEPDRYERFVSRVAGQVRAEFIVQITVVWKNPCVNPGIILESWNRVAGLTDGMALWTGSTAPRPFHEQTAMALAVLGSLS